MRENKMIPKKKRKFLESQDTRRIILIDSGGQKQMVLEDRKTGKMEAFDIISLICRTQQEVFDEYITKTYPEKFALMFDDSGKAALGIGEKTVYLGFQDSCAKFLALAAKEGKVILFIYDSEVMTKLFIVFSSDPKKARNLYGLFQKLVNLGFGDDIPIPFAQQEPKINESSTNSIEEAEEYYGEKEKNWKKDEE